MQPFQPKYEYPSLSQAEVIEAAVRNRERLDSMMLSQSTVTATGRTGGTVGGGKRRKRTTTVTTNSQSQTPALVSIPIATTSNRETPSSPKRLRL